MMGSNGLSGKRTRRKTLGVRMERPCWKGNVELAPCHPPSAHAHGGGGAGSSAAAKPAGRPIRPSLPEHFALTAS